MRAARTDTAGAYIVDADGNVLETHRADDHGGDGFIADIEILSGDLSRVLYDDTRDGVAYGLRSCDPTDKSPRNGG
ncbi:hypothetical protein ABZW11_16535 [Nonomuraea sp. NPDC004580]|uniref:hypothetical protein n=1 Tax=Nonomuraea sp. NPDC004580 TaxID=3154552 RepID=UPI00339E719D